MSDAEFDGEVQRWLNHARDDLAAAEIESDFLQPRHRCFFAQQAAEKAIKGALTFANVDFPKLHQLESLRNLLPDDWDAKHDMPPLEWLTGWAVEARYPEEFPEITHEDAERAAREARAVVELILDDFAKRAKPKFPAQESPGG
jgi:HEPN domain-containing protein